MVELAAVNQDFFERLIMVQYRGGLGSEVLRSGSFYKVSLFPARDSIIDSKTVRQSICFVLICYYIYYNPINQNVLPRR